MRYFIIGCGYLGHRVADRWKAAGHDVWALTRSAIKAEALRADGITPVVGDVTNVASLGDLPVADVVLYAVAYDRASGDRRGAVVGGIDNVLLALRNKAKHLVFVSTTSVYGQSNGE
jgi:nucleoside-diphosphate-sugar epimerase